MQEITYILDQASPRRATRIRRLISTTYRIYIWFSFPITMRKLSSLLESSALFLTVTCLYVSSPLSFNANKLLSDHFDQEVEASLRRDLPIITTPHAKDVLTSKGAEDSFNQVYDLGFFESMMVNLSSPGTSGKVPQTKVTGMPGKHVPTGFLEAVNDLVHAVR